MNFIDKSTYEKLCNYCVYQERCASDVKQKLTKLKVEKEGVDAYLQKLKDDNFLNEERYVKYFVSAHLKKKWGKSKIKSALGAKRIAASLVKQYLDDVDEENYGEQIKITAQKKWNSIKGETLQEKKTKLMRFLLSKGYEMDKVMRVVKEISS